MNDFIIPILLIVLGILIGYYLGNKPFRDKVNLKLKESIKGKPKPAKPRRIPKIITPKNQIRRW